MEDLNFDDGQHPLIYQRWLFLASKLEGDVGFLEIPLRNIARWIEGGRLGSDWALVEWRGMIERARGSEEGFGELLDFFEG